MKLALGCGSNEYGDGWITLDRQESCDPDVVHDLETGSLPFEDERFSFVRARHVLEHLEKDTLLKVLKEIHRVLESGGVLKVTGPHFLSWNNSTLDHRTGFGKNFFDVVSVDHDFVNGYPDLFRVETVEHRLLNRKMVNYLVKVFGEENTALFFPNTVQEISFKLVKASSPGSGGRGE